MKIRRIEVNHFGKLNACSIDFSEGMNFVYGNNEDGKSTLMAFLKLMFYSNVGSVRDLTNPRKKYRPWNGSTMGGAIEFEDDGKLYRIQKSFGQTGAKDEMKLYCVSEGREIFLNRDEEAGSHFFHMELEGFERSVFIGQSGAPGKTGKSNEISERLTNLTTSADETVSLSEALRNLNSAAEQLLSKRGNAGILAETRERLLELTEECRNAQEMEASERKLREEYEVLVQLQKAEKERLFTLQKRQQEEMNAFQEASTAQQNCRELESQLAFWLEKQRNQEELSRLQLQAEKEKLARVEAAATINSGRQYYRVFFLLAALATAAGVLAGLFVKPYYYAVIGLAGIFVLLGLAGRHREKQLGSHRRAAEESAEQLRQQLQQLEQEAVRQAAEQDTGCRKLQQKLENAERMVERKRRVYEEIKQQKAPGVELEREIMMRDEAIHSLRSRMRTPKESLQELLREKREAEQQLAEQQLYYDALQLAIRVMEQSAEEMRKNFGPALSRRTAEIFSALTGKRYTNVMVSRDFDISVLPTEDIFYREGAYLSNGTIDQVYFALRLAIVELLSQNENRKLPMLFDDVFEQYDEKRIADGLKFLSAYTRNQEEQVIFFTCHKSLINQAREFGMEAEYLEL